uniref:Uncharacterized protein n=1 Tax=Anguilla anguilla TaxID=7936 RepID=A0A0E9UVS3_ANGAN
MFICFVVCGFAQVAGGVGLIFQKIQSSSGRLHSGVLLC